MLARCPVCDELVTIESRGYEQNRRRQIWIVLPHETKPEGDGIAVVERCEGTGRRV